MTVSGERTPPPSTPTPASEYQPLVEATRALIRTVDGLDEAALAAPSLLPGWSRAHMVAHLTGNAAGLERVLSALTRGETATVYDSPEARDDEIDALVGLEPIDLRRRLMESAELFSRAVVAMPEEAWTTPVERTPGGPRFPAAAVVAMRRREVEIHHADLDTGYTPSRWPTDFTGPLLESLAYELAPPEPFTIEATDTGQRLSVGSPGPVDGPSDGSSDAQTTATPLVRGRADQLAWWLVGRGTGADLVCTHPLPTVGRWR